MNKKVLIVCYYWPPAGGPGVQRWLTFANHLCELGWEPIVYVPQNPSYPIIDTSLEKKVSPHITIISQPIWEPYAWAEKLNPSNTKFKAGQFQEKSQQSLLSKLSVFIRGNFFIPDARKYWVKPSVQYVEKYIKLHQIPIVITTGPPHSLHLIGMQLSENIPNLKWVADFRDPWTTISYHKELRLTSWAQKKHQKLENTVLSKANLIISTSYSDADHFIKLGAKEVVTITNGFEEIHLPKKDDSQKFCISYVGMLENLRNPLVFWKALEEWIQSSPDLIHQVLLQFVGKVDDDIMNSLQHSILKDIVEYIEYVPKEEAQRYMQAADVVWLCNFTTPQYKGIIPGKLFEYMSCGKPIISIGPKDADVEQILHKTSSGKHFTSTQQNDIVAYLKELYQQKKEHRLSDFQPNWEEVQNFSRKNLTHKLATILSTL